jgi:hypothetical protein
MDYCKHNFLHLIKCEIEEFYKIVIPECREQKEAVYVLANCLFGLYKKKLQVNFLNGEAINYKISHYIFGRELFCE